MTTTIISSNSQSTFSSLTMSRPSLRSRGISDLGRSAADGDGRLEDRARAVDDVSSSPMSSQIWTGVLYTLPWIVAAYAFDHRISPDSSHERADLGKQDVVSGSIIDACFYALSITSMTYLAITAAHRAQQTRGNRKGKASAKRQLQPFGSFNAATAMEVASRILGLVLPLAAAMLMGGVSIALVMVMVQSIPLPAASISRRISYLFREGKQHILKLTFMTISLVFAISRQTKHPSSALFGALSVPVAAIAFPLPILTATTLVRSRYDTVSTPVASLKAASRDRICIPIASYTAAFFAVIFFFLSPSKLPVSSGFFSHILFASVVTTALISFSEPSILSVKRTFAFPASIVVLSFFSLLLHGNHQQSFVLLAFVHAAYAVRSIEESSSLSTNQAEIRGHSSITIALLKLSKPGSIVYTVLNEPSSRRIAYFGVINLMFMLVQFFYGFATGSLGLLTDSIHMLFDCVGLGVGLAAAVMAKWPPSEKFPYGYAKISTLSGFANGIFLILVSVEIVLDAFHRLSEGAELRRLNELLVVSILGLLVNIIGLTAFGDAHHHGHSHGDGHHHHHDDNMRGIYLHVLSDALGSVAVIISTLLTKYNTWHGWDPLASCFIATAIAVSAYPLVTSSGSRLLLSLSDDAEYKCRGVLQGLSELPEVKGYAGVRFWLTDAASEDRSSHNHEHHDHEHHEHDHEHSHHDHAEEHSHSHHKKSNEHAHNHTHKHSSCSSAASHKTSGVSVLGAVHIMASPHADIDRVRDKTEAYLRANDMDVLVHVETDGTNCWCGGGSRPSPR